MFRYTSTDMAFSKSPLDDSNEAPFEQMSPVAFFGNMSRCEQDMRGRDVLTTAWGGRYPAAPETCHFYMSEKISNHKSLMSDVEPLDPFFDSVRRFWKR